MIDTLKKTGLALAMAATALVGTASQAEARGYHRGHDGGDDAALAIGAGIIGLAIGAAIADRGDDRYYDADWYPARRYVMVDGYPDYYYYYDGYPNVYYRDRYYNRYYGGWYEHRRHDRWNRGYGRVQRWYGRGGRGYYRGDDAYRGGRGYYRGGDNYRGGDHYRGGERDAHRHYRGH